MAYIGDVFRVNFNYELVKTSVQALMHALGILT